MNIMASGWWIDISFKVEAPKIDVEQVFTKQIWQWRQKYQRKSSVRTRTTTKTISLPNLISETIANRMADHMIEYAPRDESPRADNIVLQKDISAREEADWVWTVGSDLPYATRRNYENFLNPDKTYYVESAYELHASEYDDIAREIASEYIDTLVWSMTASLNSSSWATKGYNWWDESRGYKTRKF